MLAALLFLLPSYICGSKEIKNFNIETEKLPNIDVFNGLDKEHDDKTSGLAVNTVEMREAEGLTDDNDYHRYPLCGDKPMYSWHTCYCGN